MPLIIKNTTKETTVKTTLLKFFFGFWIVLTTQYNTTATIQSAPCMLRSLLNNANLNRNYYFPKRTKITEWKIYFRRGLHDTSNKIWELPRSITKLFRVTMQTIRKGLSKERKRCRLEIWLDSTPGVCFLKVPKIFRARKAIS